MKTISIGRSETCDIVLSDAMISRRHAMLRIYATGKMEIVDLSQNGTFVNNIRIKTNTPFPVTRKDVVFFAESEQLDWTMVPNPMKRYRLIGVGILALVVIAAIIIAVCHLSNTETPTPSPLPQPDPTESVTSSTDDNKEDEENEENNIGDIKKQIFPKKKPTKQNEQEPVEPEEQETEENNNSTIIM